MNAYTSPSHVVLVPPAKSPKSGLHGYSAARTPLTIRHQVRCGLAGLLLMLVPVTASADVVTDWNEIMELTVLPSNPFVQSRNAAITQLAVFDAVNSILGDYEPYVGVMDAPPWASPEAATVAAAHRVLSALYPGSAPMLDIARDTSLSVIEDGPAKDAGFEVGITAANTMLALRADDGSASVSFPYTGDTNPGEWRPTPPGFANAALPGWGQVMTFGIESGSQFRPGPPPALHTGVYARDLNEVKALGDVNSSTEERPPDRTLVAQFYAVTLPVHIYSMAARQMSAAQGMTISENARHYALLAMATADALIASMEAKFYYNVWRPVTAIQLADTDWNRKTVVDPFWMPLITTPPYPSYPGNHLAAGIAARGVLEHIYGKRGHHITITKTGDPSVALNYTAIEQITSDIDDARIYGGIHFRFDHEASEHLGRKIAQHILRHELRPRRGISQGVRAD